jgi:simple sugar transport system permease protein
VAVNLLATGGTVFVLTTLTGSKVTSSSLPSLSFPNVTLPGVDKIPVVGDILSGHNLITYLAWLLVILTWILLYRTRLGHSVRAVGENEDAAMSAGIGVNRMKFFSLALCGLFCGFGGMYLSMGSLRSFTAGMTAGRGYLSLAMNAMSQGNPAVGFLSSLLYGFFDSVTIYLQLYSDLDLKLIMAMPYILIIAVLFVAHTMKKAIEKSRLANAARGPRKS